MSLELLRCADCRHWVHFPEPWCPACASERLHEEAVPDQDAWGVLETFTVIHRVFVPGFEGRAPYAVGWVGLDLQPGLRVFAGLVGIDHHRLRIGQRVRPEAGTGPSGEAVTVYTPTLDQEPS